MAITAADVKAVVSTTRSDADLATFMDTANLLVNELLLTCGMSATRLDKIRVYLSAHYLTISDGGGGGGGGLKSTKLGEAQDTYFTPSEIGSTGMGLDATVYGQQAIALDSCGILAGLLAASKPRALFEVI